MTLVDSGQRLRQTAFATAATWNLLPALAILVFVLRTSLLGASPSVFGFAFWLIVALGTMTLVLGGSLALTALFVSGRTLASRADAIAWATVSVLLTWIVTAGLLACGLRRLAF